MSQEQQYTIRLKVEGGQVVGAELGQLGAAGAGAFQKIKTSADLSDLAFANLKRSIVSNLLPYFGAGALASGLKAVVTGLAEINDTAERTGTTVEKLQELRFAAVQIGESAGLMDDALFEFNKHLGEAQGGLGRFLPILKEYNIQLVDSNGNNRAAQDVLREYVDKIAHATTQQERLFLATKAFGDEAGKKLIEVFQKGSAGLDDFSKKAHEAGDVIDTELIKKADEFKDAWERSWYSIVVHTEAYAMQLIGVLDKVFSKMPAGNTVVLPGGYMPSVEEKNFGGAAPNSPPAVDDLRYGAGFGMSPSGPVKPVSMMPASISSMRLLYSKTAREAAEAQAKSDQSAAEALKQQIDDLKFRNEQMMRSNEEQELYNQLRQAGVSIDSEAGQQIKTLVDAYNEEKKAAEEFNKVLQGNTEETKKQKEEAQELGLTFQSAFEDAIVAGKSFSDVLGGLRSDIERIVARRLITEPMTDIFSGLSGMLGGFMPSFATGIDRVPNDMIAQIHQGEAVLNKSDAEAYRRGGDPVQFKVEIIDQAGVQVEARPSNNGQGLQVILKNAVKSMVGNGDLDGPLRSRYGVSPSTATR